MTGSAARKISHQPSVVWFVARGATLKGPFSSEQLEDKISKKEVTYFDYCWRHGFSEWRPISSLDEFDRRESAHRVPSYPSVEVPFAGRAESRSVSSIEAHRQPEASRKVHIHFAKGRRQSITAYEWAAAILFSVFLSYFAANFAMNEIRNRFLSRVAVWQADRSDNFGIAKGATPPSFWTPLFSAPGLAEVVHLPAMNSESVVGVLPVRIQGHPSVSPQGKLMVAGYEIQSPSPLNRWNAEENGVDPVYSRRMELQGYLSPSRGGIIFVRPVGDPGLLTNP